MTLTKELLQEEILEFTNTREDFIEVSFHRERFQFWLNGELIKSTKALKPIQQKLDFLTSL